MPRLEVRCCCQPKKLLGWLDVEKLVPSYTFAILPALAFGDDELMPVETVTLPMERIWNENRVYVAIKAEETPIETLRRIPGFMEAE